MSFDTMSFEIGKNRIEALSDGIFAIVMTLLILEFHVPNLPSNAPNLEVAPALVALWPKFASYIVTFMSLGFFWVGHHIMYHAIRRAERTLLWLNSFLFHVRLHAPILDQRAECLFRSFHRAALLPRDYRLDTVLSMALNQVLTPVFARNFSEPSYGFRPGRSAQQAVRHAQAYVGGGSDG